MALGHWLKDYLGPKASGEGGGSTGVSLVEVAHADVSYDAPNQTFTVNSVDKTYTEIRAFNESGKAVTIIARVNVVVNGQVVDGYTVPFVLQFGNSGFHGTYVQAIPSNGAIPDNGSIYGINWLSTATLPAMAKMDIKFTEYA